MATLSDAAFFSKKATIVSLIAAGALICLLLLSLLGGQLLKAIFPPKAAPASVAFGQLPKLDLSEGIKPPVGVTYTLETITGNLPALDNVMKVFAFTPYESSFGALSKVKQKVAQIGFTADPTEISPGILLFVDPANSGRTLTVSTSSGNFELKSDYLNDSSIISGRITNIDAPGELALAFFKHFDFDPVAFPPNKTWTIKYKIDNGRLIETPAFANSNLVQVNFGRSDVDNVPVLAPKANDSSIEAMTSNTDVVGAKMNVLVLAKNEFSTYPLKGVQRAFADLKAGNAAYNQKFGGGEFIVRSVDLEYLDSFKNHEYLQPVYVFKSDSGLAAYVGAVADEWTR